MGKHTTDISLSLFNFLRDLGNGLGYYVEIEFPMSENSFGSQAIDIAWLNEQGNKFPLFIFEIESTSNNSIPNNPTKVFGKDSKKFEKPLFFFHIIIEGAENSEKYSDLLGNFGRFNYDIFRINYGDTENLLLKIISQHRRIHNELDLLYVLRIISETSEIKSEIEFERLLNNLESLIHENQFYRIGQVYADVASRDKSFQEQYVKFIQRTYLDKKLSHLSYESYSASITSEFINLGIFHSTCGKESKDLDFTSLLVEAQKTETFSKIEYLPGLNYDYGIFIHDHVPFYIALTFFLFDGNLKAQKYILDIAIKTIRKLNVIENFTLEHHLSWGLLMSASRLEFSETFEELKNLANNRNGILNTILFCPTFINDHQEIPDSKLVLVPERDEYLKMFTHKFGKMTNDTNIIEIAIMSLSEDWKDGIDYHFNLGVDLTNLTLKSLVKHE